MNKVKEANDNFCWLIANRLRWAAEQLAEGESPGERAILSHQAFLLSLADQFYAGWFEPTVYRQRWRPNGMSLAFDKRFEVAMFIQGQPGGSLACRYEAAARHFGISERMAERCRREFITVAQMPTGTQREHAVERLRWAAMDAEAKSAK
jgi:hypothetical protein